MEREKWPVKMKVQQKNQKVVILEVKFKLSINGTITDGRNVDTFAIQETLDTQWRGHLVTAHRTA